MKKLVVSLSLLVASSVPGFAAVTLQNSDAESSLGTPVDSINFSNFNLSGGNAVAVTLTFETVSGLSNYTVTYGGEALTLGGYGVDTGAGAQYSAIYYLLNPTSSSGDLTVSTSAADGFAASVFSLGSVGGVGDFDSNGSTGGGSTDLTYVATAGDYVVGAAVDNSYRYGGGPSVGGAYADFNGVDTLMLNVGGRTNDDGGTKHWGAAVTEGGTFTTTVSNDSLSSRNSSALLVFEASEVQVSAIPEPSGVLALGCLFGASMLTRRRS